MRAVGLIPCRYRSSRFPGKPLADINGKPMMWHVYNQSLKSSILEAVYIATDDERIERACNDLELNVLMTRTDHHTGTDRVAECVTKIRADYYVNIQGDEPLIRPDEIDAVVEALATCSDERVAASNACVAIEQPWDVLSTDVVKVVVAADNTALYYSRQAIPYPRGTSASYLRQLGLYCFREASLTSYGRLTPGPLERTEEIEMLRLLEHGHRVLMVQVEKNSISVDTEVDLERVRALIV